MIPRLLLEREAAKKKEISERESINVEEATIGILTEEERKELTENEYELMHRHTLQDPTNLLGVRDDDGRIRDPHVKARVKELKHEEWREIEIGPYDLLKDGQMVMVSVCDPFDAEKFHPTDKIVVAKINGNYHATGAFCGFDYTPLAKGALIGSRIICPTCTSTYNMQTGFIE